MADFGPARTIALLEANNRPPVLSCAVLDADRVAAVAESLGPAATPGRWLRSALTIGGGNPTALAAFQSGEISLQDEASQMVAHLAGARPGDLVLDVCSAPGGKTTLLARAVAPNGSVIAADLHEHRLRSMREQLTRTGATQLAVRLGAASCDHLEQVNPSDISALERQRPRGRRRSSWNSCASPTGRPPACSSLQAEALRQKS